MDLKSKVSKLETKAGGSNDPKWRERLARESARSWVKNIEPLFADFYGTKPKTFDEIFKERKRELEAFASESAYYEHLERLKPVLYDLEMSINYRVRLAEDENRREERKNEYKL